MSRLPTPGGDDNTWGNVLNDFLAVEHNTDGTLKTSGSLNAKEDKANKGIAGGYAPLDGSGKVPSGNLPAGSTPDATTSSKGVVQLAGDLAGTAALPTVPGLSTKANDSGVVHNTGNETIAGVKTFSSNPIVSTPSASTEVANKSYVDGVAGSGSTPDADAVTKGKVQLAGDLSGTAAAPTIAAGAITSAKIADGTIVNADVNAAAAIAVTKLAAGSNGQVLTTTSGAPAWGASAGGPPSGSAGGDLTGTYPNPTLAVDRIPKSIVTTKGDVIAATASATPSRLGVGTDGQVLTASAAAGTGLTWSTPATGGSAHIIEDEGTPLTARNNLNFTGAGVTAADSGGKTVVTIPGGGGSSLPATLMEWYVDSAAAGGGNGRSPATAFTTFAAAISAANPRDIIYILSDLNEKMIINKQDVRVVGVGRRVLYGDGSSTGITVSITSRQVRFENFLIYGTSTFTGVHLCVQGARARIVNVDINGDGGNNAPTFYANGPAGSTGTKTGIGGIGILCHNSETSTFEDVSFTNCAIGIGLGTRSTGQVFRWGAESACGGCSQFLVGGLDTGTYTNVLTGSGPYAYGGAEQNTTGCSFYNWRPVSSANPTSTSPPIIDLIGDGSTNNVQEFGGNCLFVDCSISEGGTPTARFGTRGNVFLDCSMAYGMWKIEGERNLFDGFWSNNGELRLNSSNNRVVNFRGELSAAITLTGNYNQIVNATMGASTAITGAGIANTLDDCSITSLSLTGVQNRFRHSAVAAGGLTRASFGPGAEITYSQGINPITYATTMTPVVSAGTVFPITVTNTTAFTIANAIDGVNASATSTIVSTNPFTLDILNSSGGTMGTITWGAKYLLQGGTFTNPANGKRVLITFYYNAVSDKWVEMNRTSDI